ncbi:MAG: histidine kinase [Bacteroidetes bacterium]|nr:histidine kinase [Bacteroidota bacterium]
MIRLRVLILAFLPVTAVAQTWVHHRLSVENGLVQSQVASVFKDREGFLWLGTFGGLTRWDGFECINYQTQDGLAGNRISSIVQKKDGTLIFGIDGGGVSVFKNGRFDTLSIQPVLSGQAVTCLLLDPQETLYIGTFGDGIWILPESGPPVHLTEQEGLPGLNIWTLRAGADGSVWIGTDGAGLCQFKNGKITSWAIRDRGADNIIRAILPLPDGSVLAGLNSGGIRQLRGGTVLPFLSGAELTGKTIWTLGMLPGQTLLIGTSDGVLFYQNGKLTRIGPENGLPAKEIYSHLITPEGWVFLGTSGGGLAWFKPGQLASWSGEIAGTTVLGIAEDPSGTLWMATYGNGVWVNRGDRWKPASFQNQLPDPLIWSVTAGHSGKLFFGTSGGLAVKAGDRFTTLRKKDGLSHDRVYSVCETREGVVWVATRKGANRLENGKLYPPGNPLLEKTIVWRITEGADSTVYFCADGNGLITLKNGRFSVFGKDQGLKGDYVISALKSSDGRLLIGTDGAGLTVVTGSKTEILDARNGLPDNTVYAIEEYRPGHFLLTTNKGACLWTEVNGKRSIRLLLKQDGMVSNEHNLGSALTDSQGRIWMGQIGGLSVYDPGLDPDPVSPPVVYLTGVSVFDVPLGNVLPELFSWDQNYLKFSFTGINLPELSPLIYSYRLEGLDPKTLSGKERTIQYTNLSPGKYTFRITAVNDRGMESRAAVYSFTIRQAWWKSWWFYLALALAGAALVSWLIYNRVQQLLAVERLRTRLAADLHDTIGSGLTEIYYLAEMGRSDSGDPAQTDRHLSRIGQLSRALVKSMSDIVWLVNPGRDSVYDLIIRLRESYEDILASSGVEFRTGSLDVLESVHLTVDARQNLFLIFKEAVNNSLKYSGGTVLSLTAGAGTRDFFIELTDNGSGFDPAGKSSGNGLVNMKQRAGAIGGKLEIRSEPGSGTRVRFEGRL